MSIIDRFTSTHDLFTETHSDDNQQNNDRVLNPETRRALDRELLAARRLWAVILAFVPFVYASAVLWTLDLSLQLFAVLLAGDLLAGIAASMYVAIRFNLLLRPRGVSQALADSDTPTDSTAATDAASVESEPEPEEESEPEAIPEDGESIPEESTQPIQSDQQESDAHESPDPEAQPDSKLDDEQPETQSTNDTADTSSERVIS